MSFLPVSPQLLFSRNDPTDPRLGETVMAFPPLMNADDFRDAIGELVPASPEPAFVVAGYPDDEGIKLNGGRLGAQEAPNEIRRWLYRMTPSVLSSRPIRLMDAGNLDPSDLSLEGRHELASVCALTTLNSGARWIGLGGGHDYGFSDAAAFVEWAHAQKIRPLVINFDAHLDVRPATGGFSSGTPFFRMLELARELGIEIDFAEIGIQAHCNSRAHLDWAQERGVRILMQEEVEASGEPLLHHVTRVLGDWLLRPRPVFLSIDIDGFSSAVAPGCSQSWATGFTPEQFFPVLNFLVARLDVRMLSVYEVSPALDQDGRTAKLAAQVIHRLLSANGPS